MFASRLAGLLAVTLSTCSPVEGEVRLSGFLPENVNADLKDLGVLDDEEREKAAKRPDLDAVRFLDAQTCNQKCRSVEVVLDITNDTTEPLPPPVVRPLVDGSPSNLHVPVTHRFGPIEPKRTGRIRFVVDLPPEGDRLSLHLSSSVVISIVETVAP